MQVLALRYSNTYTVDKLGYEQPPAVFFSLIAHLL
jgi:hypothetical protein